MGMTTASRVNPSRRVRFQGGADREPRVHGGAGRLTTAQLRKRNRLLVTRWTAILPHGNRDGPDESCDGLDRLAVNLGKEVASEVEHGLAVIGLRAMDGYRPDRLRAIGGKLASIQITVIGDLQEERVQVEEFLFPHRVVQGSCCMSKTLSWVTVPRSSTLSRAQDQQRYLTVTSHLEYPSDPGGDSQLKDDVERARLTPSSASTGTSFSLDTVFELLSNRRRRFVLYTLEDAADGIVDLRDLIEEVTTLEAGLVGEACSRTRYLDVASDLYHWHLEVLANTGVLSFDKRSATVRYQPVAALEEWLDRARVDELG